MAQVEQAESLGTPLANRMGRITLSMADRVIGARRIPWSQVCAVGRSADATRARFAAQSQRSFLHANVLVLKPRISERERGVLLLKYTEILNGLPVLFDVPRIQERYHLVLEPSFSGHLQQFTRFFDAAASLVMVQTARSRDGEGFNRRGFLSIDLCNGDWVDETAFQPVDDVGPQFDFAFIGNPIPFKRHAFLFDSLAHHWHGPLRFALLMSRWIGSGEDSLRAMLESHGVADCAEIFVDVGQRQVNEVFNASRCHVRCSIGGGADKASFEALFAGIPAIVPDDPGGFPTRRFPRELVRAYATGRDLVARVAECRSDVNRLHIATVARHLSGSLTATRRLSEAMREAAVALGEEWTMDLLPKVNRIHACYRSPESIELCDREYGYLASCARGGFVFDPALSCSLVTRIG